MQLLESSLVSSFSFLGSRLWTWGCFWHAMYGLKKYFCQMLWDDFGMFTTTHQFTHHPKQQWTTNIQNHPNTHVAKDDVATSKSSSVGVTWLLRCKAKAFRASASSAPASCPHLSWAVGRQSGSISMYILLLLYIIYYYYILYMIYYYYYYICIYMYVCIQLLTIV